MLIIVASIDCWFSTAHPLAHVSTVNTDRGEIFNAVTAYHKELATPEVVLLGSSLMLTPVMQAEAIHVGKPIPRMSHRRISLLEKNLSTKLKIKVPAVFCLAVSGEMISDAYLIVKNVLANQSVPCSIIYGIAPRDLQDNCFSKIEASETFRILSKLEDVGETLQSSSFEPLSCERVADLVLGRISGLWRYRDDIKTHLLLRVKKLMERCLPWVLFDKYTADSLKLKPSKRGQFPEEAKGILTAFPKIPLPHYSTEETRFQYIRRYNPLSSQLINKEFAYFDRLLTLCNRRGITIVVVNMPLSRLNLSLMPKGFYNYYLATLQKKCTHYNVQLVDLQEKPFVADNCFVDGVHLTPQASLFFLNEISAIVTQSKIATALRKAQQVLSTRQALLN